MDAINNRGEILFVIVICGCKIEESITFKTLIDREHIHDVFVYDNTATTQYTDLQIAEYVHDTSNGGLGKAYNTACKYAVKNDYKWMMLLDQDTYFPKGALSEYTKAIKSVRSINMIVPQHKIQNGKFMSPTHYFMKTSKLQDKVPTGYVHFNDASPINSGMLISVESFIKAGGYEESVWLDFSDICFIEKYKKIYDQFYVLPQVVCAQTFSSIETDKKKIYKRFRIYLECARNFPCDTILDRISLNITTLRPTLSRTINERSFRYINAYWNIYILGKNKKNH